MEKAIKERYLEFNGWKFYEDGVIVPHHICGDYEDTYWDKKALMDELKPVSFWSNDSYECTVFEDIDDAIEYEIEDVQGLDVDKELDRFSKLLKSPSAKQDKEKNEE